MIVISIDLTAIPSEARKKHENGKVYASIVVDNRKDVDQYGNTHTVYINQTKEQREAKEAKVYVGNGKEIVFNGNTKTAESKPEQKNNNLGF